MMMLLHCCPTQGQLCPTWQSYAGLPPEEGALRYVLSFPPPTVILSRRRRISVRAAVEKIGNKYRSAGRLPIGSPGSGECLFGLQRSTPLRHFVALFPSRGRKGRYGIILCVSSAA